MRGCAQIARFGACLRRFFLGKKPKDSMAAPKEEELEARRRTEQQLWEAEKAKTQLLSEVRDVKDLLQQTTSELREAREALMQAGSDIAYLETQLGEVQQLLKATREEKRAAEEAAKKEAEKQAAAEEAAKREAEKQAAAEEGKRKAKEQSTTQVLAKTPRNEFIQLLDDIIEGRVSFKNYKTTK